jgi:hypothetical protein
MLLCCPLILEGFELPLECLHVRLLGVRLEATFRASTQACQTRRSASITLDGHSMLVDFHFQCGVTTTKRSCQGHWRCRGRTFVLCSRHGSQAAACRLFLKS